MLLATCLIKEGATACLRLLSSVYIEHESLMSVKNRVSLQAVTSLHGQVTLEGLLLKQSKHALNVKSWHFDLSVRSDVYYKMWHQLTIEACQVLVIL